MTGNATTSAVLQLSRIRFRIEAAGFPVKKQWIDSKSERGYIDVKPPTIESVSVLERLAKDHGCELVGSLVTKQMTLTDGERSAFAAAARQVSHASAGRFKKSDDGKMVIVVPSAIRDEVKAEAARLDRSVNWLLTHAWKIARARIRAMPGEE